MKNNDMYMKMKENETYIAWKNNNVCIPSFYINVDVEILENDEGIKFAINCDDKTINVLFAGIVPIYMRSEEGIRVLSWSTVQEKNKDKSYFSKWPIYKIENSCLIKWALMESCGFY